MKTLDIFLKALENNLGNKRGFYVPRIAILDCKFPAYKRIVVDIWCVDGAYKNCISKVDATGKYNTIEEKDVLHDRVVQETIQNILKYYGI